MSNMGKVWMQKDADRAWEMAGLARQDGDKKDEARYTEEARRIQSEINEYFPQPPITTCECGHSKSVHIARCVIKACKCTCFQPQKEIK